MNYGYLQLVSQEDFTDLSVNDIKQHLNVTDGSFDSYIATLLESAVVYCERKLELDLRGTTWKLVLDSFPLWGNTNWYDRYGGQLYVWPAIWEQSIARTTQRWQEIPLRRGPLKTITSITYYDAANVLQTLASDQYAYAMPSYQPGKVEPVLFWPVTYPRPDSVSITFGTGFDTVPANILHAIRLLVGSWWVMRESLMYGPQTALSVNTEAVDSLLSQFMVRQYS